MDLAVRSVTEDGMSLVGDKARIEVSKLLIAAPTAVKASVKVVRSPWTSIDDGAARAAPRRVKGNMVETSML